MSITISTLKFLLSKKTYQEIYRKYVINDSRTKRDVASCVVTGFTRDQTNDL